MARYGFRYDWRTAGLACALGLVPPLTYAEVADDTFGLRLGPWFALRAPLGTIAAADVARGELGVAPNVAVSATPARSRLQVRTAKGPLLRVRFAEAAIGRLPIGPPRIRPRFAPIVLGHSVAVDEIVVSVADPGAVLAALER